MVGKIRNVETKVAEDNNQLGLERGKEFWLVTIDRPEYILGFEENDHSLYNYV